MHGCSRRVTPSHHKVRPAAGRFQMDKCALADITGIIGPHDGAACRNDALRGFRKLHIFAKRSTIEGDIGATIRRDIRYDGVTTIVGGDGVIVGQLDVIKHGALTSTAASVMS